MVKGKHANLIPMKPSNCSSPKLGSSQSPPLQVQVLKDEYGLACAMCQATESGSSPVEIDSVDIRYQMEIDSVDIKWIHFFMPTLEVP